MTTLFVSGADERYGFHLLNMLGSVKANSDIFDRIVVYDLGLNDVQRRLLDAARGIEVRTVPPFVPHWAQGRTWKTWIWTHVEADEVFWLDAGATVLRPLDHVLAEIREHGYFAVSQGHPNRKSTPAEFFDLYGLTDAQADQDAIAAGIFGFATDSAFYDTVVVPTYEDALAGRTLGFSRDELGRMNVGLDRSDAPIVRDCAAFRWDQTVLNIHFAQRVAQPRIHDVYRYAGWTSSRADPEQVIWSHRRRGDYRYLWRLPYAWRARPWAWSTTARIRARWLRSQHGWKLRPRRYVQKLRRVRG